MSKPLDFPIPYPGQLPNDDLATARLLIDAVVCSMEDGRNIASAQVQSLFSVLCAARTKIDIVQLFLDDCDCPDMEAQYQAARRLWIMQHGGARA